MTFIKLKDVSVQNGTIYIAPEVSKIGKDSVVTQPDCMLKLMVELGVLSCPADWYLFSDDFRPGKKYRSVKQFTDAWTKLRKQFGWPAVIDIPFAFCTKVHQCYNNRKDAHLRILSVTKVEKVGRLIKPSRHLSRDRE